jgi:hypothetical protein
VAVLDPARVLIRDPGSAISDHGANPGALRFSPDPLELLQVMDIMPRHLRGDPVDVEVAVIRMVKG